MLLRVGRGDFAVSFIYFCQYPSDARMGAMLTVKLADGWSSMPMVSTSRFAGASEEKPLTCSGVTVTGYSLPLLYTPVSRSPSKLSGSPKVYAYFMRRLCNGQPDECSFVFRLLFSGGEGGSQADFKLYVFSGIYRFPDGPYTVLRTAAFLYDKCQEALRLSGEPYFAGQREQGDTPAHWRLRRQWGGVRLSCSNAL